MEYQNLQDLIKTVSDYKVVYFSYEEKDTKVYISFSDKCNKMQDTDSKQETQKNEIIKEYEVSSYNEQNIDEEKQQLESQKLEDNKNIILSPLVGLFYAAPSEDSEPFVKLGDKVKKGQILAILEAMKLMNDIESEYDGVISEIYVKNGESVEYGQPLFAISPKEV